MMTADFLRDEGFEVIEAWNADEAAKLLREIDGFDVLFTDVRMPGMLDGVDLALRARRRFSAVPVLVVSGYAVQLVARLGVLDPPAIFISKPYDLGEIADALRRLTVSH